MTEELRLAIADRKFFADQIRDGRRVEVVGVDPKTRQEERHPVRMMI
ncbi:MAG: hypothetical protein LBG60_17735 [Bifidobacteriaceae bacterium]|jgi:hypothetical protein|nr:hypothetical protein [Bifidobacteriaceae bacterium]